MQCNKDTHNIEGKELEDSQDRTGECDTDIGMHNTRLGHYMSHHDFVALGFVKRKTVEVGGDYVNLIF